MVLEECSVCGVSGDRVRILEAISLKGKGVIKICEICSRKEGLPILKRPTTFQLKESEKSPIPRRSSLGGNSQNVQGSLERRRTDTSLRDIVDRNYEMNISRNKRPRPDLVEHFEWIIMRARRRKKLTQEQLAMDLSESTAAIRMSEQGILPDDDYRLINKLESFLGVVLVKEKMISPVALVRAAAEKSSRSLKFDSSALKTLTIDDLKRIRQEKESKSSKEPKFEDGEDDFFEDSEDYPSVFSTGNEPDKEK